MDIFRTLNNLSFFIDFLFLFKNDITNVLIFFIYLGF